jgi:aspartyl protease family protein
MRNILLIGALVGVSASVPVIYQASPGTFQRLIAPAPELTPSPAPEMKPAAVAATTVFTGRRAAIQADESGHFRTDLRINGRRVEGLIDTGATLVALNLSTARRLGIAVPQSEFKHEVNTANGKTRAAIVTLATIEIGRIRVENVDAVVLDDKSLAKTLIGMSMLKQLARFEVKDQVLYIEQ